MRKRFLFTAVLLCLPAFAAAQTKETIVPAGTLLQCTLDEPRFSSETAQVGDPVVCHVNSLGMFGRPVFPRGAYLSGRFEDFRDPGHFFGKGWLKLEFASLTLPGGTFPLSAKVVSVPHYRVRADGSIRGRGHARRDAIEWAIPILWPEKLITLPLRGPRPEIKGETRVLLRVLEDVSIPTDATATSSAALSIPTSSRPRLSLNPSEGPMMSPTMNSGVSSSPGPSGNTIRPSGVSPRIRYSGVSIPAADLDRPIGRPRVDVERALVSELNQPIERPWRAPRPILLIRKDGQGYLVRDYWFEANQLVYLTLDGTRQSLPPEELDFGMTARLNRERGMPFVIHSRPGEP